MSSRRALATSLALLVPVTLGACDLSRLSFGADAGADAWTYGPPDAAGSGGGDAAVAPDAGGAAFDPALGEALDGLVATHGPDVQALGLAVGVARPDGSWWEGASGIACQDPERDVVPGDRFRVGSITKTFVAAAVLLLVDDGAITLEDGVATWLPELEGLDDRVTLRMLLNHTSGIFNLSDDYLNLPGDPTEPIAPADFVASALDHGPLFEPGQRWDYSNTNYVLLGMLIERVTQQPVAQVLRSRLLTPQGLADTFLEGDEEVVGGLICGHYLDFETTGAMHPSWAWTAGAMVSTTRDLCTWLDRLTRGDVLPPTLRALMQARTVLPSGDTVGYGLGLDYRQRGGREVIGHTGLTLGFTGEVFLDPADGTCVAALANGSLGGTEPARVARPVWEALP